jgi:ribose transport system substrate-binding protein
MKKFLAMILAVTMVLSLAACGKSSEAATSGEKREEELYSMVVFTKGAEYFNWCYAGMQDAAESIGDFIKVELQGPAEWDASQEARAVETVLAKKPNGIVVSCADESTLIPSINKAIESGVPVICFDSDSSESNRLSYVGTNNNTFGAVAGKAIVDTIGTEGEIAIIMVPGAVSMEERAQGCIDYLKENAPNVTYTVLNDEGDVAKAEQVTSALLQSNPNIKAIFSTHGYGAPGAAAACRTLNMVGDITIIGSDYDSATIELLKSGDIAGTVIDDPYLLGYEAFMLSYAAAHPTDVLSGNAPFGHVPPLIFGSCSLLTGKVLEDPAAAARYENPPKIN